MSAYPDPAGPLNMVRTGPRGGAPLVFIHAVSMDLTWWGDQFAEFGHDHDVIAVDLPGHGLSPQPQSPPSLESMAQALEQLLDKTGAGPAHLVGISLGGMVAQTLALKRPDLARSLTLVATLCTFPEKIRAVLRERAQVARTEGMERIAELSIARWFPPAFQERRPDMMARAAAGLLRQPAEYHARLWEMIARLDLEAQLGAVRCPALVVAGTRDVNAPPVAAQQIVDALPGATLRLMPELGHFPPLEDPQAFNRLLRAFIDA